LNDKSLIITSQTGSGKTLCYLLPILNRLDFTLNKVQAIIILPTKELARQIYSKINDFKANQPRLKCSLLIGNQDINQQQHNLRSHPGQIVVGTVSRVHDLLKNKSINHDIKTIVMDEADMLMDLGFIPQIVAILNIVNTPTLQKIACSATTHLSLANSFKNFLGNTTVVTSSNSIWVNDQIQHNVVYDRSYNPLTTLDGLLKNINPYFCIIFTNTKNIANTLYEHLLNQKINVCLLHKDLTTRQRKNIYREINTNRYQFLVATDLASRGLDINGADIVISYGLPEDDI
jgi:ATP-dependent RNA helicase CshB